MDPDSKVEKLGRRKIKGTIRAENTSIRDGTTNIHVSVDKRLFVE